MLLSYMNTTDRTIRNSAPLQFGMERSLTQLVETYFYYQNISSYSISFISFAPLICRTRNPFEILSGIITSESSFAEQVRCYRDRVNTQESTRYINSRDFIPIPLFPNKVIIGRNVSTSSEISQYSESDLNSLEVSILPLTLDYEKSGCKSNPQKFDALRISLTRGISNFTNFDLEWMKNVAGVKELNYDRSLYEYLFQRFVNRNNLQNLTNSIEISQSLLSSDCYYCNFGSFGDPRETLTDLWIIPIAVLTLVYFILLFATKSYSKPYLQRRLVVPYLLPICNLLFEALSVDSLLVLVYNCEPKYLLISVFFGIIMIFLYMITVIRFYYLRNLYKIVSDSKFYKVHKYLTSTSFGIGFTLIMSALLTIIFMVPVFATLSFETNIIYISQNVTNASYVVIGSAFALAASVVDAILNRKKISKNGILYYLFADDPLYVRIDLFLTGIIIIIILLTIVFQLFELLYLVGVVRTLVTIMALMISGGTAIIAEMIRRFVYRNRKITENDSDLEKHLSQSSDFFELFQEYASKEFSLENIMFFDIIHEIKTEYVTVETMKHIEENFMRNYSKYEVNISFSSRRKFYELFDTMEFKVDKMEVSSSEMNLLSGRASMKLSTSDMSQLSITESKKSSNITLKQLKDAVYMDIIGNMKDTYGRLQLTPQFAKWESVYNLQNKAAII
ncbi:predicted protein [Naegleria gruberi]|uniref:Predicted protein n=1 Tax=Naegleria gruberi TaxID=5762 RepID=D2W0F0_NAEGR|nr:uncharacterized protein NAEGRDRAFT_74835 [Naegleria gruberi]EFC37420.1 predicted protein [Naegleria gruberi]|eukprot:XP_002670164.1 predicted protein [Naegleria gruberi strain NEG-M]